MQIKSLEHIPLEDLYTAFNEVFKDYPRSWTQPEFESMLKRRSFNAKLSFGAFDGGKLVSFTLNGIGMYNNKKTAYDTATGTIAEFQGKGLATQIFEIAAPVLKAAGCEQYLLEVLTTNDKAISVYKKIGFKEIREINYHVTEIKDLKLENRSHLPGLELKDINLEFIPGLNKWFDIQPSWQNNFTALTNGPENFKIVGAFIDSKIVGYGVIEIATGDISQLAIDKEHRRKGIASALFVELIKYTKAPSVRVINVENNYKPAAHFLASKNIKVLGSQFEMIRSLA
ncbi:MAG: GNAT family N-acetyltransferase [Bacteroidetes bacterium]|nr:GNAT family N-acetyltransferase [Bacteroidota bacterium]